MVTGYFFWGLLACLAAQRIAELLISRSHATWMRAHGGQEFGAAHFPGVVVLMIGFFLALPIEYYERHAMLSPLWALWFGLFLLAQLLRYWAMISLGKFWNVRIWILPGATRVRRGPYRFLAHPNYVAVAIELLVVPLLFGCYVTAVAGLLGYAIFLKVRLTEESRALRRLSN